MLSRALAILAAVLAFTTACTSAPPAREPMTFDQDLYAKILEHKTAAGRQAVPLRSLTVFDWDTVFCYMDAAAADKINAEVGHVILDPGTHFSASASLAVFVKDGTVVKVTTIPELSMVPGRQPDGVMLDGGFLKAPDQINPPSPTPPTSSTSLAACTPQRAVCTMAPSPSGGIRQRAKKIAATSAP